MKPVHWTYELHVRGTSKQTLALEDFGELAKRFADILGSKDKVRFAALRTGSARLLADVDEEASQDVFIQLVRARSEEGQVAAKAARLNEFLGARGWRGEVRDRAGGVVLLFPGLTRAEAKETVQTVQQADAIVGQVIKIGGRDETVPMTVRTPDGAFIDLTVKGRAEAKKLAQHLFGADLRLIGPATWIRDGGGSWRCSDMDVLSFEEVDDTSLADLFDDLRKAPGNAWHQTLDPIGDLKKFRGEH